MPSKHSRAVPFDADDTGWLDNFLAEEDDSDRRSLWRLGSWAAAALGAVALAVLANQWSDGQRREQFAAAKLIEQAQRLQKATAESQIEAKRSASAVATLNADRDRLFARLTALEQSLDGVTGSLAQIAVAAPAPVPDAANSPQKSVELLAAAPDSPLNVSPPLSQAASVYAPPDPAATRFAPVANAAAAAPASSDPSIGAQPDIVTGSVTAQAEFGIDIGGATSVEGLRAVWRGLPRADRAAVAALRPIMAIRERGTGVGMQLRLVFGPLPDAAAATRLCASISRPDRVCEAARFDGQRLSFTEGPLPAAKRPPRKRTERVAPAAEAPKPAPSTLSGAPGLR